MNGCEFELDFHYFLFDLAGDFLISGGFGLDFHGLVLTWE